MLHNQLKICLPHKVNGSSLVIAIFILVVMSALGASMIKILRSSEQTYAYEVLGIRAYAAAQSGIQRKLQQIFPIDTSTPIPAPDSGQCNNVTFDFSTIDGLKNCQAEIECSAKSHTESGIEYFTINSTGLCDINGEQTSRSIEVRAKG